MAGLKNPMLWLYSLVSSVIGAAAGAVPVVIIDPQHFNIHEGWRNLALMSLVSALLALANFLKQHPLPEMDDADGKD